MADPEFPRGREGLPTPTFGAKPYYYRPQRSCGKIRGAYVAGGHVWWGACVAGVMHGRGACVARGCAWQGGMCGRGACMSGETATAADGMHPTGMHSCLGMLLLKTA